MLFSEYTEADKVKLADYFLMNIMDTSQNAYLTQRVPLLKILPSITIANPTLRIFSNGVELEPSLFDFTNLSVNISYCPFYTVTILNGSFFSNTQASNITLAIDVPETQNPGYGISSLKLTLPTDSIAGSGIAMNEYLDWRWYYDSSQSSIYKKSANGYTCISMIAEADKTYNIAVQGSVSTTYPVFTMVNSSSTDATVYYYSDVYAMDTSTSSIFHKVQPTMDMVWLICAKYTKNANWLNYGGPLISIEGESSSSSNTVDFNPSIDSSKLVLTPTTTLNVDYFKTYNLTGGAIILTSQLNNYN